MKNWLRAVSYTHLDVYKRQVQQGLGCPLLAPADLHDGLLDFADQSLVLAAVSYTHLHQLTLRLESVGSKQD